MSQSLDSNILARVLENKAIPAGGLLTLWVDTFEDPTEADWSGEEIGISLSHYRDATDEPFLTTMIVLSNESAKLLRYHLDEAICKREVACAYGPDA
jgi:hypothetical protein